jgi:VCBS repeat-containing protein
MPATTLVFKEKLIYRTPMGVDDRANAEEDRVGFIAVADLLSNDLGGAAKSFWGIDQADPRLATMTAVSREGASLSVDLSTGEIAYDPTAAFASVIQSLAEGETTTDSFTYTIRMADGALSTATVSLTIWA